MKASSLAKAKYKDPDKKPGKPGRPRVTPDSPLSRKQELFVKELVSKDGQITMREAAINAGYPESSAHTRAYELTNPTISPHVVKAISQYRAELDRKYGIDFSRHLRDLQKIRDAAFADKNYSAAVMAEYRRGQAHGNIYINKSEVRHGSIDSMSKEEVLKAIAELRGTVGGRTFEGETAEDADYEEINGEPILVKHETADSKADADMESDSP
jgi:hypothetical protein